MLSCLRSFDFPIAAHNHIPSQYILSLAVLFSVRLTLIINLICKWQMNPLFLGLGSGS